ncbi:MAG: hypothetical protein WD802_03485 [Gemmatimonadaceae bacterium]
MRATSSGRDVASQAALRMLMARLPGVTAVDGAPSIEPPASGDPPTVQTAELVEGSSMQVIKVPDPEADAQSGFAAFLDGAQQVQVMGDHAGIPIVYGTVSAAVRLRVNRRMVTWEGLPPRVKRSFFLPRRYLPPLSEVPSLVGESQLEVVDSAKANKNGSFPIMHPTALLDSAFRAVNEMREQLEHEFAEAWCASEKAPLFIDGGISGIPNASSSCAVGVVKSHRTLFAEGDALRTVFRLSKGERSSVFRVSPRSRSTVYSWYLRVRDVSHHDSMWGLVRVEIARCDRPTERADEISRWVIAEMSPLSLPDGRWDKMAYGIRDCEEFLRAIS